MLIALVTVNRKVNKNLDSIQEETSETQSSFSDNQWLSEPRSILNFKMKAMKAYHIGLVSDL